MIRVQDLGKTFRTRDKRGRLAELRALEGVDLTIGQNEFVTLLGPSGCGKTTLLKMVAGLATIDEGSISVDGEPVAGPTPDRAMVFQSFALLPWADVRRNIAFGLELRGVPKGEREETAHQLVGFVGLSGFENSLPAELSGGMRQRVGLARALAVDPRILLLDEPFGSLDEQTKRVMQEELIRIWEDQRKTVLFVTHSIDEAILLSDRVVVMSSRPGRIAQVASVSLGRPRTRAAESDPEFLDLKEHLWETLRRWQGADHANPQRA